MLASFFNTSNTWSGYITNIFFAAGGIFTTIKLTEKWLNRHNSKKMETLTKQFEEYKEDMDDKFDRLLAQHETNGGSTSKDQWNRVESMVRDIKYGQEELHNQVDEIKQNFAEHKGYHKGLVDRED